ALLGALPVALGACGLLIGLDDHQPFPPSDADAGEDVVDPPDAAPDGPIDMPDALPDVVTDACAVCGDTCVDTSADPKNCGQCGLACLAGFSCSAGVCGDHIVQISAGSNHGCALLHDRSVWCWGGDDAGQLGILASDDVQCVAGALCHPTPIQVKGLPPKIIQIAAGPRSTCAVVATGGVWCWGANDTLQLGRPTLPSPLYDRTPAQVPGLPAVAQVAVGYGFACARATDLSKVYCWGSNLTGTLGNGQKEGSPGGFPPGDVVALPAGILDISTGLGDHACALDSTQHVYCWGSNASGQLGHSSVIDSAVCPTAKCTSIPSKVPGLTVTGGWIRAGAADTCAETGSGSVVCWGSNVYGQLGFTPDAKEHELPMQILSATDEVASSFHGRYATSCILQNNAVDCWGDDTYGELGRGALVQSLCFGGGRCDFMKGTVKPFGGSVTAQLAAGAFWGMALTTDNRIYAWGANLDGRIGHAPMTSNDLGSCGYQSMDPCNPTPQLVPQPGKPPLP
ncbi:MAG: hypothetical protein ABJE95_27185, partial [Byssovorax sp.]